MADVGLNINDVKLNVSLKLVGLRQFQARVLIASLFFWMGAKVAGVGLDRVEWVER